MVLELGSMAADVRDSRSPVGGQRYKQVVGPHTRQTSGMSALSNCVESEGPDQVLSGSAGAAGRDTGRSNP